MVALESLRTAKDQPRSYCGARRRDSSVAAGTRRGQVAPEGAWRDRHWIRPVAVTVAFFVVSLAYAVLSYLGIVDSPFYWSPTTNGFAFFGGSLTYFIAKRFRPPVWLLPAGVVAYVLSMYVAPLYIRVPQDLGGFRHQVPLFVSVAACMTILFGLTSVEIRAARLIAISAFLGSLAYPVFLLHLAIGEPIAMQLGSENRGLVFALALTMTVLVSALLVIGVERPLVRLRARIRGPASQKAVSKGHGAMVEPQCPHPHEQA